MIILVVRNLSLWLGSNYLTWWFKGALLLSWILLGSLRFGSRLFEVVVDLISQIWAGRLPVIQAKWFLLLTLVYILLLLELMILSAAVIIFDFFKTIWVMHLISKHYPFSQLWNTLFFLLLFSCRKSDWARHITNRRKLLFIFSIRTVNYFLITVVKVQLSSLLLELSLILHWLLRGVIVYFRAAVDEILVLGEV